MSKKNTMRMLQASSLLALEVSTSAAHSAAERAALAGFGFVKDIVAGCNPPPVFCCTAAVTARAARTVRAPVDARATARRRWRGLRGELRRLCSHRRT